MSPHSTHTDLVALEAHSSGISTLDPSSIVVFGFLFVVFVLSILALTTSIFGFLFAKRALATTQKLSASFANDSARASKGTLAEKESSQEAFEESAEIQAVVAAAVHAVTGGRLDRIVSIRSSAAGAWAQEGRRHIFSSRLDR